MTLGVAATLFAVMLTGGSRLVRSAYADDAGRVQASRPSRSQPSSSNKVTVGTTSVDKKVSDQKDDGSYDIVMSATGATTTEVTKSKVDVLFVLDYSGSMGYFQLPNGTVLERAMKNSVDGIQQALKSNERYVDYRTSLVWFNGCGPILGFLPNPGPSYKTVAGVMQGWQSSWDKAIMDTKQVENQTNYQAGLIFANEQVDSMRKGEDVKKVVVFLSDGDPNRYVGPLGNTLGVALGSDEFSELALINAKKELAKMDGKIDAFYVVGLGQFPDKYAHLSKLASGLSDPKINKKYFEAKNQQELEKAFSAIKNEVMTSVSHVTLTDTMSDYVDITTEGNAANTYLRIIGPDGEYKPDQSKPGVTSYQLPGWYPNRKAQLKVVTVDGKQRVSVEFPPHYPLDPKYRYELVTNVKFNEKARQAYLNDGEKELLTNDNDETTFTYYEGDAAANPPKEELTTEKVQVDPVPIRNFQFTKIVKGLDLNDLGKLAKGTFNLVVEYPNGTRIEKSSVAFNSMKPTGVQTTRNYTGPELFNLPNGTKVYLSEDEASFKVDGYDMSLSSTEKIGENNPITVGSTSPETLVKLTNEYVRSFRPHKVKISKKVEGSLFGGMKDKTFSFIINMAPEDSKGKAVSPESLKGFLSENNPKISSEVQVVGNHVEMNFSLKSGESIDLVLPDGFTYELAERLPAGCEMPPSITLKDLDAPKSEDRKPMDGAKTLPKATVDPKYDEILVTNYANQIPPTLFSRNNIPFAILALGGGTILTTALILTRKRRLDS